MTEQHIISKIVKETGIERELAEKILFLIFEQIKYGVFYKSKHMVQIRHFGTFELKYINGKKVDKHFMTGESVVIDAHTAFVFQAYSDIRKRLLRKELRTRKREYDLLMEKEKEKAHMAALARLNEEVTSSDDCNTEQESDS